MIGNNLLVLWIVLTATFHTSVNLRNSSKNDEDDTSTPQIIEPPVDLEEISELINDIIESIPTSNNFITNRIPKIIQPQPTNDPGNINTLHNPRKCTTNKFIPSNNNHQNNAPRVQNRNQVQYREHSSEESSDGNSDDPGQGDIYSMSDGDSQNGSGSGSNSSECDCGCECGSDCGCDCGGDSESESDEVSSSGSDAMTEYTINSGTSYSDSAEYNSNSSTENNSEDDSDDSSSETNSSGSDDSDDESSSDATEHIMDLRSYSLSCNHAEGCGESRFLNKPFDNNEVRRKRESHPRKPTDQKSTGPSYTVPATTKPVKHSSLHKTQVHTSEVSVKHETALKGKALPHNSNLTTTKKKETSQHHPNDTYEAHKHVQKDVSNITSKDTNKTGDTTQNHHNLRVIVKNDTGIQKEKFSHSTGFIQGFVEKNNSTNEVAKGLDAKFDILHDEVKKPVWRPFVYGTGTSNREEVVITDISLNTHFSTKLTVNEWVSLNHQAAGRYNDRLTLVTATNDILNVRNQELGEAISCLSMFEWWNAEERSLETILITAENAKVNWYHFSDDNQLEQLWSWNLIDPVLSVDVFKLGNEYKALIVYESRQQHDNLNSGYAAIFTLNLWKNWSVDQNLNGNKKPAITEDAQTVLLPHAGEQQLFVYKYDADRHAYYNTQARSTFSYIHSNSSKIQCIGDFFTDISIGMDIIEGCIMSPSLFNPYIESCVKKLANEEWSVKMGCTQVLKIPGMANVCTFTTGAFSFFAVSGDVSAIYQIKYDQIIEVPVSNYHLEYVEKWLPINVNYFRNDVILLCQHKLDHLSHRSITIEALKWNGKSFEIMEHAPCRSHEEEMYGFSCIIDAEGQRGISGAVAFSYGDKTNVLLASEIHTPVMFEVNTEIRSLPDPISEQLQNLINRVRQLNEIYDEQKKWLKELNERVGSPQKITGINWDVKSLHVPSVHLEGRMEDYLTPDTLIKLDGRKWSNTFPNTFAPSFSRRVEDSNQRLKNIVSNMKRAVKKTDKLDNITVPFVFNGGLIVKGKTNIARAKITMLNGVNIKKTLESSLQRSLDDHKLHFKGKKQLKLLNIDKIFVSGALNGIKVTNFKTHNEPIVIDTDLKLEQTLKVIGDVKLDTDGLVNNLNIEKDVIRTRSSCEGSGKFFDKARLEDVDIKVRLEVLEKMNGLNVTSEGLKDLFSVTRDLDGGTIDKDHMRLELLNVDSDVRLQSVNGRDWGKFEDNVIFVNQPTVLEELHLDGIAIVSGPSSVKALNNLDFPGGYVVRSNDSSVPVLITGKKIFKNDVKVDILECEGKINNIIPKNFVTLETTQFIPNLAFKDLSVTENFNIRGNISGADIDKILTNPTLHETTSVKSNIIFTDLQVDGKIIVKGDLNGSRFSELAADVLLKSDEDIVLDSLKEFEGTVVVNNGLHVRSGMVNNIAIDDFLTTDTEQILESNTFGNISFDDIQLKGLFGGLNLRDLDENSVKINGDEEISGHLTFITDEDYRDTETNEAKFIIPKVKMENLIVTDHCNNWQVDDNMFDVNSDVQTLNSEKVVFNNLKAVELVVEGNLITDKAVGNIDLNDFENRRLSRTKDQAISSTYVVENCLINSLNSDYINSRSAQDILNARGNVESAYDKVLAGEVILDNLNVTGNLTSNGINSIQLREIAAKAIWLNRHNEITGNITFLDPIEVNTLQIDGYYGNVHFPDFISDTISTDDKQIQFGGRIRYESELNIINNLDVNVINNIKQESILKNVNNQEIDKYVMINGDVYVKDLHVDGYFNNVYSAFIKDKFRTTGDNEFYIYNTVNFPEGHKIGTLYMNGQLNDKYVLNDIISELIWLDEDSPIVGKLTFNNSVTFSNSLNIGSYNNINVDQLIKDIVFTNVDNSFNGTIEFTNPIYVEANLNLTNVLNSEIINGCNMTEWKLNAILLNEPQYLQGRQVFRNVTIKGNLNTATLNELDMKTIIPLTTGPYLPNTTLYFKTLQLNDQMNIDGLFNNVKLQELFNKTLLNYGTQIVTAPLVFHSNITVTESAYIDKVNSHIMNNLVTLDSDQTLYGKYVFTNSLKMDNFQVTGKLNGVNINNLAENAIYSNDYGNKNIAGSWDINGRLFVDSDIGSETIIDGQNVTNVLTRIYETNTSVDAFNKYLKWKYQKQCMELRSAINKGNDNIVSFKYFEEIQVINLPSNSETFSSIKVNEDAYIMIPSHDDSCFSEVWTLSSNRSSFKKVARISTGNVEKWRILNIIENAYLVSVTDETENDCSTQGAIVWNFKGDSVEQLISLASIDDITTHQEKKDTILVTDSGKLKEYKIISNSGKFTLALQSTTQISNTLNKDTSRKTTEILVGRKQNILYGYLLDNAIQIYSTEYKAYSQIIEAKKPTSLVSLNFHNHETLIVFSENGKYVTVYSYAGIEGFKFAYSIKMEAEKIEEVHVKSLTYPYWQESFLLVQKKRQISVLQAVMARIKPQLGLDYCNV